MRDCPDWKEMGAPSGDFIPSERGQLFQRKTFDYKEKQYLEMLDINSCSWVRRLEKKYLPLELFLCFPGKEKERCESRFVVS